MDREKGTFERHPYDPAHPEKLSGPPPQNDVGLDLNNFFVTEDSSGAIWIASSKRWVTRYDPKTKKINHFDSFNGDVAGRAVGLQKFFLHAKGSYGSQPGTAVFSGLILSRLVFHMFLQVVVFMQFMKMFQVHYGWVPWRRSYSNRQE